MRWIITGTTASTSARLSWTARSVSSGSKRRRSTIVEAVGRLIDEVEEAPGVEERRRDHHRLAAAVGDLVDQRRDRAAARRGWSAGRPSGVPVVPEVRITKRGLSGGGFRSDSSPAAISASSVVRLGLLAVVGPADDPRDRVVDALEQAGELLVVDERLRPLAARHLDQLRAGEHRVEVERAGAELGRGQGRLDEAAVVAAHDPDPVAVADPHRARRSGRARWSGGAGARS